MTNKQPALIVFAIFIAVALLWFAKQDPALNHLNSVLKADQELMAYPYQFRAMKLDNGIATLTTPRSAQVSVLQFFKIAFPTLDTNNPDTPQMIAAQKQLAQIQEKAAKLVKAQPGISEIEWEIDRAWYSSHGVTLP